MTEHNEITRSWAADHPGRICKLCSERVYPIWVDTVPPPGICVEDEDDAKMCAFVRSRIAMNFAISRDQGKPMHERMTALMQRVGLTVADIEAYLAHDKARLEAHYALLYQTPAMVGTVKLTDWLADGDPEAKLLALLDEVLHVVEKCDGKTTLIEIQDHGDRFAKRVGDLVRERLCHSDYESGEADAE